MSDERALSLSDIGGEIVGDVPVRPARCCKYDPSVCDDTLGARDGYGTLCAAHDQLVTQAIEHIRALHRIQAKHDDDRWVATVSDDRADAYRIKYPQATKDEARRLAAWELRLENLAELVRLVAFIAPQGEREVIPGLPAVTDQHRDLNVKLNRLRVDVELRGAPKLREPTPNQLAAIEAEVNDWKAMSEGDRQARIETLLAEVKTLDDGAWDPYVEDRSYLIWDAGVQSKSRATAFRTLLCLSRGLDPGNGFSQLDVGQVRTVATTAETPRIRRRGSGVPTKPGRPRQRWITTWRVIKDQVCRNESDVKISEWLDKMHPSLSVRPDTVAKIRRAGLKGELD